jgi:hypothetical protein
VTIVALRRVSLCVCGGCGMARVPGAMMKTTGMEFFCYHRDRPGSVTLRYELLEQHWSYMDR